MHNMIELPLFDVYVFLMRSSGYTSKADKFRAWLKKSVVDECPPELYACEVCGAKECSNEKWLNCESRIKARDFMLKAEGKALPKEASCGQFEKVS